MADRTGVPLTTREKNLLKNMGCSEVEIQHYKSLFFTCDTDLSGYIEPAELLNIIVSNGGRATLQQIEAMMNKGKKEEKRINFVEFVRILKHGSMDGIF